SAKVAEWLALGLETVWMAYPSARSVHIYTDVRGSRILGGDELLEGRGGLAGFRVPVCALLEG
ncbi:MAG: Uma2 family endonuclease, partial [Aggregatilineales bacterium]